MEGWDEDGEHAVYESVTLINMLRLGLEIHTFKVSAPIQEFKSGLLACIRASGGLRELAGPTLEGPKAANIPDSPLVNISPQRHVVVVEMADKPRIVTADAMHVNHARIQNKTMNNSP